jgi:hypothetical protein
MVYIKGDTMRKSTILIVVSLTSLIIMACGIGGYTQYQMETQPTIIKTTDESPSLVSTQNSQEMSIAGESQTIIDITPTKEVVLTPTATVDPLMSSKGCLARTWEIEGLNEYIIAAIPPEMAAQYSLEYVDTTGQAFMTLSSDEEIILHAENLTFNFSAQYSIFKVPVKVNIDGIATGKYAIDTTSLSTRNMDTSQLSASARALDEDLIDPTMIIESIPLLRPPFNTATYSCDGNILKLKISGYPENVPSLVFQAVD